ncbi:polyphosphate kinase 2 [Candidatus Gracilibacteria bacterium 28_42_T64]|nr:polyphosphate kinase 2 [Candidatus Gracilibacteria bacterium 28_42_T64]
MPSIFYEIFNKHIDLNAKGLRKIKGALDQLFKELAEKSDIDNLKVTRNRLEILLHEKGKKADKKGKKDLRALYVILDEINDFIEEKEKVKKDSIELVDVVKKVENKYKVCKNVKEEKRGKYIQTCVKQETIDYEKELIQLQVELLKLQKHIKEKGEKLLIIFEGRDAAGKGGTIKRFREYLNPRGARVVALEKPTDLEKSQWYFQRYVNHLPSGGEMAFFDRSWYNRAGVEPVMGFVNKNDYNKFLTDVPLFEKMLIDSGTKIIKFYFSVSKSEQAKRFDSRRTNPLKQFKLSPIDQFSQELWGKYSLAEYKNFSTTHSKHAPWTLVKSDDKKKARVNAIKYVLNQFDYEDKIDKKALKLDPEIVYDGEEKVRRLSEEIDIKKDLFE